MGAGFGAGAEGWREQWCPVCGTRLAALDTVMVYGGGDEAAGCVHCLTRYQVEEGGLAEIEGSGELVLAGAP